MYSLLHQIHFHSVRIFKIKFTLKWDDSEWNHNIIHDIHSSYNLRHQIILFLFFDSSRSFYGPNRLAVCLTVPSNIYILIMIQLQLQLIDD